MNLRVSSVTATVIYAVILAGVSTLAFYAVNEGIDPRADHHGYIDPDVAPFVGWSLIGVYTFNAIIFFDEEARSDRARRADSSFGFVLDPLPKVLAVGPIFALWAAPVALWWRSMAVNTGAAGSLWADYTSSALPLLTMLLAIWAAVNFSFALAAVPIAVDAGKPKLKSAFGFLPSAVGAPLSFGLWGLTMLPTLTSFLVAVPAMLISFPLLIGTRHLAIRKEARSDKAADRPAVHPQMLPPELLSILRENERIIFSLHNRQRPRTDYLLATTQRILHAAAEPGSRAVISDQALPGQLTGGSSRRAPGTVITLIHFRDRPDMHIIGSDDCESERFASALIDLAKHGLARAPSQPGRR